MIKAIHTAQHYTQFHGVETVRAANAARFVWRFNHIKGKNPIRESQNVERSPTFALS